MWNTGLHVATHDFVFARTSGKDGGAKGITCFIVPMKSEGFKIEEYLWTFNMPTDHPRVSLTDVSVPADAMLGDPENGLAVAQHFVHENRIRQAASSLGAAQYCINESVKYAKERKPFGKPLATNQAIQWPLVELQTEAAMLRALIHKTAWEMDQMSKPEVARRTLGQGCDVQLPRESAGLRRGRSRDAGARRASATRGTSRSSTFIGIIGAIASPKARRKSRCGASRRCMFGFGSKARRSE